MNKKSRFNKTNDNIDWAAWTWNPVTGCKHGCEYCYATDISHRFQKTFEPVFFPERLSAPANTRPDTSIPGGDKVFVCSMADLFGEWVPNDWIFAVIKEAEDNPQWTFIFLTKNPRRYSSIPFPDNAIVGATVDVQARVEPTEKAMEQVMAPVKFVSCEPMLEPLHFTNLAQLDLVIIGGRSKTTTGPEQQPEYWWVHDLMHAARDARCMVYGKPNLRCSWPKEFPIRSR